MTIDTVSKHHETSTSVALPENFEDIPRFPSALTDACGGNKVLEKYCEESRLLQSAIWALQTNYNWHKEGLGNRNMACILTEAQIALDEISQLRMRRTQMTADEHTNSIASFFTRIKEKCVAILRSN